MSTPTFTREDLEVLAGGQTLAGGRIADVCDLARYALALVRNINEWMIYKQRRIDDLEAELAAEKVNLNRANDEFEKARAALEAERDALREALKEAAETIHAECHPVQHMDLCLRLASVLGEKDGGK
jgi:multidrug resistance efflux pump